jgi:hypothetical protein
LNAEQPKGTASAFISLVLGPAAEGQRVRLENRDTLIVFGPGGAYTLTDQKTGKTLGGKAVFTSGVCRTGVAYAENCRLYLLEGDPSDGADDPAKAAGIALAPVLCRGETVRFVYERPAPLFNTEVSFTVAGQTGPPPGGEPETRLSP